MLQDSIKRKCECQSPPAPQPHKKKKKGLYNMCDRLICRYWSIKKVYDITMNLVITKLGISRISYYSYTCSVESYFLKLTDRTHLWILSRMLIAEYFLTEVWASA